MSSSIREEIEEKGYEFDNLELQFSFGAINFSPTWRLIHAFSIYFDYLYSTLCYSYKRMPFLSEYIWMINMLVYFMQLYLFIFSLMFQKRNLLIFIH